MFDLFDPSKIFIVGVVALIVIGPKELPRVMRTVGQVVGRMRRMAAEFQQQFNEAMREAELEDVKKELAAMNEAAKVDVSLDEPAKTDVAFDPARLTQHENVKSIEAEQMKAIEAPAAAAPNGAAPEAVNGAPAHGSGAPTTEAAASAAVGELPAPQSELADSVARESGAL